MNNFKATGKAVICTQSKSFRLMLDLMRQFPCTALVLNFFSITLNALLKLNVNPCRFARVFASDVDNRCVLMTFIQLALYGIPATVFFKNAVSNETFGVSFKTPCLKFLEAHHD